MYAMGANFVRLTVLADDSQLDVSLPAHRPLIEYIDDVVGLLGARTVVTGTSWVLSSPTHGSIELDDSLADQSVLDGSTLYLTSADNAAQGPFVDDVIAEMQNRVDFDYVPWAGSRRGRWLAAATGAVALWTCGILAVFGPRAESIAALALLAVLGLVAGFVVRPSPSAHLSWISVPTTAVAIWFATDSLATAESTVFVLGSVGVASAAAAVVAIRSRTVASTFLAVAAVLLFAGALFAVGVNPTAFCVWTSVILVLVLMLTPRSALATSGLPALIRQTENMELVDREAVRASLARGREIADVLVWSASLLIVPLVLTVCWTGVWQQGLLCLMLALVYLLRSRSFTHARHVGPIVVSAALSLAGGASAIPQWFGMPGAVAVGVWTAIAVLVLVSAATIEVTLLPEVASARVRRFFDIIDLPCALAYIPLVFFAQGLFTYYWP